MAMCLCKTIIMNKISLYAKLATVESRQMFLALWCSGLRCGISNAMDYKEGYMLSSIDHNIRTQHSRIKSCLKLTMMTSFHCVKVSCMVNLISDCWGWTYAKLFVIELGAQFSAMNP